MQFILEIFSSLDRPFIQLRYYCYYYTAAAIAVVMIVPHEALVTSRRHAVAPPLPGDATKPSSRRVVTPSRRRCPEMPHACVCVGSADLK